MKGWPLRLCQYTLTGLLAIIGGYCIALGLLRAVFFLEALFNVDRIREVLDDRGIIWFIAIATPVCGGLLIFLGRQVTRWARSLTSRVPRCGGCGYDLRGNPDAPCPECGPQP